MAENAINFSNIVNFGAYAEDEVVQWAIQKMKSSGIYGYVSIFPEFVYKSAVKEFFIQAEMATPQLITSSIHGKRVEISKDTIREAFQLPTSEEAMEVGTSGADCQEMWRKLKRTEVSNEFRSGCKRSDLNEGGKLLMDILLKVILAHHGSFDQMSSYKWQILGSMLHDKEMDWATFIFNILKSNVDKSQFSEATNSFNNGNLMLGTQLSFLLEHKKWLTPEDKATEIKGNKIWGRKSAGARRAPAQREPRSKKARMSVEEENTSCSTKGQADENKTAEAQGEPGTTPLTGPSQTDTSRAAEVQGSSAQSFPQDELAEKEPTHPSSDAQPMSIDSLIKLHSIWLKVRLMEAAELRNYIQMNGWSEIIKIEEQLLKFSEFKGEAFVKAALHPNFVLKTHGKKFGAVSSDHTSHESSQKPDDSVAEIEGGGLPKEQQPAETHDKETSDEVQIMPSPDFENSTDLAADQTLAGGLGTEVKGRKAAEEITEVLKEETAKRELASSTGMTAVNIRQLVQEEINNLVIPRVADLEKKVDDFSTTTGTNAVMLNKVKKSLNKQVITSRILKTSISRQEETTESRFNKVKSDLKKLQDKMDNLPAQLLNAVRTALLNIFSTSSVRATSSKSAGQSREAPAEQPRTAEQPSKEASEQMTAEGHDQPSKAVDKGKTPMHDEEVVILEGPLNVQP